MSFYMYLFWAPKHLLAGPPRSSEQARESGEKWSNWEEALRKAGHQPTGAQIEPGGKTVTGISKTVVDGAFGEEYVLGGYFMVSASSLDQATELAKGCPLLQNGGTVEVRPVMGQ